MPDGQHVTSRADAQHLAGRPTGRLDERHAGFQQVDCDRCGAAVLVAKFSPQHTSVQWSQPSVRACAEFSARAAAGEQTALIDTCASLRDSIDHALSEGRLEVSPP
jgi:hypothetical protein